MAKILRIDCLAIDSSSLFKGGWPYPSLDLDNLAKTCRALGLPFLIPELVEVEIAAVWKRRTDEATQKSRRYLEEVAGRVRGLIKPEQITWPTDQQLDDLYLEATNRIAQEWDYYSPPIPKVALPDLLRSAARHEPPFKSEDVAFRDAIVVMSVIEVVEKGAIVGLIADDNYFQDAAVQAAAKAKGVELVIFKTPQEAWAVVEGMARITEFAKVFEESDRQRKRLLHVLESDRDRLDKFLREHLAVPQYLLDYGSVRAVHDMTLGEIIGVDVGLPLNEKKGIPEAVARIELQLNVATERFSTPPEVPLRIGQIASSQPLPTVETFAGEISGQARVQLAIKWPSEEETPPIVEYLRAEFRTERDLEIERQALIEALGKHGKKG